MLVDARSFPRIALMCRYGTRPYLTFRDEQKWSLGAAISMALLVCTKTDVKCSKYPVNNTSNSNVDLLKKMTKELSKPEPDSAKLLSAPCSPFSHRPGENQRREREEGDL